MTLKLAQFCDDPKRISTKSFPPPQQKKKIFIFLKTPKNIEIQNFEPKKIGRAYVCVKISEYPPPPLPPPPPWAIILQHRKGHRKEWQSLSKVHWFYFKINIIIKSML